VVLDTSHPTGKFIGVIGVTQDLGAAIADRGTILDTVPELFDSMFAVNVRAPLFLMQEPIKVINRERIQGSIVNIGWMASEGEDRIQREFHHADADWLEKAAASQPNGRLVDPLEPLS
jgi:NAD(P)-dependent dehydrogenase (short-subunit alcohol dehydrogenase family)